MNITRVFGWIALPILKLIFVKIRKTWNSEFVVGSHEQLILFTKKKIRWILPESSDELLYRFWKLSDREEEEEKHQWLPHKGTFWSYFVWWFLFVFFASYPDELKAFVLWLSLFSYLTQKFSLFMSRKYWILGLHMKRRLAHRIKAL